VRLHALVVKIAWCVRPSSTEATPTDDQCLHDRRGFPHTWVFNPSGVFWDSHAPAASLDKLPPLEGRLEMIALKWRVLQTSLGRHNRRESKGYVRVS
jgi:hypothetical protein